MGINIKNPRTGQLIRELAELTGEGKTAAVTKAVEAALTQARKGAKKPSSRLERILAIAHRMAPRPRGLDIG